MHERVCCHPATHVPPSLWEHLHEPPTSDQHACLLCLDQTRGVYRPRHSHHLRHGAQPLGGGLWLLHYLRGRQDPSQPLQPLPPTSGVWVRRAPQGTSHGRAGHRGQVRRLWGQARPSTKRPHPSPYPTPTSRHLDQVSLLVIPLVVPAACYCCLAWPLPVSVRCTHRTPDSSPFLPFQNSCCLALQGSQDEAQACLPLTPPWAALPATPLSTHIHRHTYTRVLTCMKTPMYTRHTYTPSHMETHTRAHVHALTHAHTHTCSHTMHTHSHTYRHASPLLALMHSTALQHTLHTARDTPSRSP